MVGEFDRLAAAGWRAAAVALQSSPQDRETLLDGPFAKALDDLRAGSDHIEHSLRLTNS